MAESYENEKLERQINNIVDYFYRNNKKFYATAVQNAQSRVRLFESGGYAYQEYNHRINKGLCEALFYMNSDPYCDTNNIKLVRKLIESYRDMNGLSTVDFATDCGEDKVVNVVDGKFSDFVKTNDKHNFILLNTVVDEEYNIDDIVEALYNEFYSDVTQADEVNAANEEIMKHIEQLIQQGHFVHIGEESPSMTQVEPIAVLRVK